MMLNRMCAVGTVEPSKKNFLLARVKDELMKKAFDDTRKCNGGDDGEGYDEETWHVFLLPTPGGYLSRRLRLRERRVDWVAPQKLVGKMERFAFAIGLRPEAIDEYRRIHAAVWPDVLDQIRRSNIRNYSIFFRDGLLFAYYEYVGTDHASDMAKMAEDPRTQAWWEITMPMQERLDDAPDDGRWSPTELMFHVD